MARTRAFKSGNSQAIRIPAEIAYADTSADLEIVRTGDVITIYPARGRLRDLVDALSSMPKPSEIEKREPIEIPDREPD